MPKKTTPTTLTATNLKKSLWDTLQELRNSQIQPGEGDAIACQAREILRTVKVQLQVAAQTSRPVPAEVIEFSEK